MSVRSLCRMWSEPVGQLDIAVAGALRLAQRLEQGFVADAVELAGDRLKVNVGHRRLPSRAGLPHRVSLALHALGRVEPGVAPIWLLSSVQFGAIQVVQPSCPNWPRRTGSTAPAGMRQFGIPIELVAIVENRRGRRAARTGRRWAGSAYTERGSAV